MLIDDLEAKVVTVWAPERTKTLNWSLPDTTIFNIQSVANFLDPEPQLPKEIFRGGLMHLPFPRCWFEWQAKNGWRYAALARYQTAANIVVDYFCQERGNELRDTLLVSTGITRWDLAIDEKGLVQNITHNAAHRGIEEVPGRGSVEDPFIEADTACLYGAVAIYLLNWKQDVTTHLNQPTRQQRRRAERNGAPRPKEHRNLIINPWVTKFYSVSNGDGGGWEQRWHAVRGHSRTWTEDAPMYGCEKCRVGGSGHGPEKSKSHVGSFWISSYFSGNKNLGEIEHRYSTAPLP